MTDRKRPPARLARMRGPLVLAVVAAGLLHSSVLAPAARAEETDTVVGVLVQAWPEHLDRAEAVERADDGPVSWVQAGSGDPVRVVTEDVADIAVGSTVSVTVGDEVEDAAAQEQGLEPAREVLAATVVAEALDPEPPVAASGTPTNRVTVVRVVPDGRTAGDATTAADVAAVVNGPVSTYWSEQTPSSPIRVAATAWPADVLLTAGCDDWFGMWREAAAEVGFQTGNGNHLLLYLAGAAVNFPDCPDGLGTVGGPPYYGGLLYTTSPNPSIITHELGHNFGLAHSSVQRCGGARYTAPCETEEYADFYDVMGFSWGQMGSLNVAQLDRLLDYVTQTPFMIGYPTTTVTLAPVSQQSGVRAVKIDAQPGKYWLEYRPAAGRDAWLGTADNLPGLEPGVLLRQTQYTGSSSSLLHDGTPSPDAGDLQTALPVGVPVEIAGGSDAPGTITVTVTDVTPSGAVVRLSGSPARPGSSLVRTPENGTVYLLSGTAKHPVGDMATVSAFSPLGSVAFISQQRLDRWTTGAPLSRVVAAPDGQAFFVDAGIRLPFASCAQVVDFGSSCASAVPLEQSQIDAFHGGPPITPLYRTTSGKAFHVSGGVKREVADDAALIAAGLPTTGVRLLETGLGSLPYGVPVTRDGIALRNRSTGAVTIAAGGSLTTVPDSLHAATALRSLPVRALDDAGLRLLAAAAAPTPVVQESGGSRVFLLTDTGKRELADPAIAPASPSPVSAAFLGLFPDAGTVGGPLFVRGSTTSTVYALRAGQRRPVRSILDLLAFYGAPPLPTSLTIDQRLVPLLPIGPAQLGPATLVVSPRSQTVFFVNGPDELVPVTSFARTDELGATRLVSVPDTAIDAYTVRSSAIGTAVDCAGTRYLGLGGRLHRVDADAAAHYPLSYTSLHPLACGGLPKAGALTRFLRESSGRIYHIENGVKRPIRSYPAYLALGGTAANTLPASAFALSLIPTGPVV